MPTARSFTEGSVSKWLDELAVEQQLRYPAKLHCWHSFESMDSERLAAFGQLLERKFGWEFVGMWPNSPGSSTFHLRVKKTAISDHDSVIRDVRQLTKLAEDAGIDVYASCEPQDGRL